MNRKALKAAARQHITEAQGSPKIVTLVFLLGIVLLTALQWAISTWMSGLSFGGNYLSQGLNSGAWVTAIDYVVSFGMQVLNILLCIGYAAVALDIREGTPIAPRSLLAGFSGGGRSVLAYVLKELYMLLWAMLWSIPASVVLSLVMMTLGIELDEYSLTLLTLGYMLVAVVVVSYRYWPLYFILMDQPELSARQTVKLAAAMTRGHRWQLFLLDLSFLPWVLLSVLTCGILLIWKLPYIKVTYAEAYEVLKADQQKRQEEWNRMREQFTNQRPE